MGAVVNAPADAPPHEPNEHTWRPEVYEDQLKLPIPPAPSLTHALRVSCATWHPVDMYSAWLGETVHFSFGDAVYSVFSGGSEGYSEIERVCFVRKPSAMRVFEALESKSSIRADLTLKGAPRRFERGLPFPKRRTWGVS